MRSTIIPNQFNSWFFRYLILYNLEITKKNYSLLVNASEVMNGIKFMSCLLIRNGEDMNRGT